MGARVSKQTEENESQTTSSPKEIQSRVGSVSLPVTADDMHRGAPRDVIPAITEPKFGTDWEGITVTLGVIPASGPASNDWDTLTIDPRLEASDPIIGIERGGEA